MFNHPKAPFLQFWQALNEQRAREGREELRLGEASRRWRAAVAQ